MNRHTLMGILVYLSLRLLIPVFYSEYKKYLHTEESISGSWVDDYFGKWICMTPYTGIITEEQFGKDEFIVTYEGYNDKLRYNRSKGTTGEIHYSELDTYWRKEYGTNEQNNNTE